MPVHIDQFESELTFAEDQSGLSEEQLDRLVTRVLERLDAKARNDRNIAAATELRTRATPPDPFVQ